MTNPSKPTATFIVIALRPEGVLDHLIRQAKINTQQVAGDQIYLSHPPHLTLYVAAFDEPQAVVERCRQIAASWQPPRFEILGWHHFSGDVLTGNQTLVCQIDPAGQIRLREYQAKLIDAIHGLRNTVDSFQRYRPHFDSLSPQRQLAVENVGFPFIGSDWIPHFTIASINPSEWDAVWNRVKEHPPQGTFTCDQLVQFRLVDDFPHAWQSCAIGTG